MSKKLKLLMVLIIVMSLLSACGEGVNNIDYAPIDNNDMFEPETGTNDPIDDPIDDPVDDPIVE